MADPTEKRLLDARELEQVEKLSGLGMSVRQIGYVIGVSKSTMERRIKDQPELAEALEKGRAMAIANVSKTAYQLATSGKHPVMTIFFLKCRAGWSETDAVDEKQDKYKAPKSLRLA
jgi:IS30 family transposase